MPGGGSTGSIWAHGELSGSCRLNLGWLGQCRRLNWAGRGDAGPIVDLIPPL